MELKFSKEICRTYKGSGKCPLSDICKKYIELSSENVIAWIQELETKAEDLLDEKHTNEQGSINRQID